MSSRLTIRDRLTSEVPDSCCRTARTRAFPDVDGTNPVGTSAYRVVAEVNRWGRFRLTLTNAYSGNNGRAAILNDTGGDDVFYTAGNAGNGGNPQPDGIITGPASAATRPPGCRGRRPPTACATSPAGSTRTAA